MKNFKSELSNSFKNDDTGFSIKKLIAAILILAILIVHVKWVYLGDFKALETVLIIDYGFIASLLGMSTYQNLRKFDKNGVDEKKDPE